MALQLSLAKGLFGMKLFGNAGLWLTFEVLQGFASDQAAYVCQDAVFLHETF